MLVAALSQHTCRHQGQWRKWRVATGALVEIPLQPMERTSNESWHCSPWRTMQLVKDPTIKKVDLGKVQDRKDMESPCRSRLWTELQPTCRNSWWYVWSGGSWNPHQNSLFLKDYTPWKGSGEKQFTEDCILWGPHAGARKEYKDDGSAGMKHYETDHNPHTLSACAAQGEEVKEGGWGKVILVCLFVRCSHTIQNTELLESRLFFPGYWTPETTILGLYLKLQGCSISKKKKKNYHMVQFLVHLSEGKQILSGFFFFLLLWIFYT